MLLDPTVLSSADTAGLPSARITNDAKVPRPTGWLPRLSAVLRATHQARIPF